MSDWENTKIGGSEERISNLEGRILEITQYAQ